MPIVGKKVKPMNKNLTEEYIVKFWFKNKEGFTQQSSRSFFYEDKNKHKQAEKDCISTLLKEKITIEIISVTYQ